MRIKFRVEIKAVSGLSNFEKIPYELNSEIGSRFYEVEAETAAEANSIATEIAKAEDLQKGIKGLDYIAKTDTTKTKPGSSSTN